MGPGIFHAGSSTRSPFVDQINSLGQILAFLLIVAAAIYSISELAARAAALDLMTARIASIRSDYVERNTARIGTVDAAALQAASRNAGALRTLELRTDELEMLDNVQSIDTLRRGLLVLSAIGGRDESISLSHIVDRFREIGRYRAVISRPDAAPQASSQPVGGYSAVSLKKSPDWSLGIDLLSSDKLLAIAVITCGAIGALIAMFRAEGGLSMKILLLGLSAGFITYLAIKGGRHIFLIHGSGEFPVFNPYGSAFAGLVAGLFTEKGYLVLSHLVEELSKRLMGQQQSRDSTSRQGSTG